jgi:hypothetical protein
MTRRGTTNHHYYKSDVIDAPALSQSSAARIDAEDGSARLLSRLHLAGQIHKPVEPRKLSFEEQLALVAEGKARVVEMPPLTPADPGYTLGGVTWEPL